MTPDAILDFILMTQLQEKSKPPMNLCLLKKKKKTQSFAIVLEKAMSDLILSVPQNLRPYWTIAKYSNFKSLYRFNNLKKQILLY